MKSVRPLAFKALVAILISLSNADLTSPQTKAPSLEEQFKDIQANIGKLESMYNSTCMARLNATGSESNQNSSSVTDGEKSPYTFEYKDLVLNDDQLSEITPWFRKELDTLKYDHEKDKDNRVHEIRILSIYGMLAMLILCFISFTTCYSAFSSYLIFFQPRLLEKYYQRITKQYSDTSNLKHYYEFSYFHSMQKEHQDVIRQPIIVEIAKFIFAAACIGFIVVGLQMNVSLKQANSCGVLDAGLAITKGRKEGSYSSEFGLFTEKTLLTTFIEDLKDMQQEVQHTFDLAYKRLTQKKLGIGLDNMQKSLSFFHEQVKSRSISSCKPGDKQKVIPRFTKNMTPSINQNVKRQTSEFFSMVENIDKGSGYLAKLLEDKDEKKLEKVAATFQDLYTELSVIGMDFYKITDFAISLSSTFERNIGSLNIFGFVVICFAIILVLPRKCTKACGLSDHCLIVAQLSMSCLVIGVGVYLLYKSQLAVQYCRYSFKALDNPSIVNDAFGPESPRQWAEVCLSEDSFGEIDKLISERDEDYLTSSLAILKAFSIDLNKELAAKYKMNTLISFRDLDQKIQMIEGREVETLDEETDKSATLAIEELNKVIECSGYQVELTTKYCEQKHKKLPVVDLAELGSTDKDLEEQFPTEKSCLVLGNLERAVPLASLLKAKVPASNDACQQQMTNGQAQSYVKSLQKCMWEVAGFVDYVRTSFEVPKQMVADTLKHLNEIKDDFNTVRLQFRETFQKVQMPKESNGKGWDLQNVLSCKSVRKEAIQIIGNFCATNSQNKQKSGAGYQEVQTSGLDVVRNGFGVATVFIVGGILLCGGSLMKFLLGIVEKRPDQNYQMVDNSGNADSPDSSVREDTNQAAQVEFETELGTI